jgi:hypothetical protein
MAVTTTSTNNQILKFRKEFWREYRRENLFSPYMGEDVTSIIQILSELREGGDQMNVPLIGRLRGPGVGTGPLTGNEEKLDSNGARFWIDWSRNAVLLNKKFLRQSSFDQLETVRPLLMEWGKLLLRDEIILALHALPSESPPVNLGSESVTSFGTYSTAGQRINGIVYASATAAQKNTWHTANLDRVQYGNAVANYVAGSHSASLANISTATGRLTAAGLLLMKRRARKADPAIKPYMTKKGGAQEYFVCFAGSNAFRDLASDSVIVAANQNARPREGNGMDDNPLFQDGDLLFRGIIIREIPELEQFCTVAAAGAAGINVAPVFMLGQNAVAVCYGQMWKPTERKEDDYGFLKGRGIEACYGLGKVFKRFQDNAALLKDWSVYTAYFASIDDA